MFNKKYKEQDAEIAAAVQAVAEKRYKLVWRQYKKNLGAMIGLGIIIALLLTMILTTIFLDYETDVIGLNTSQMLVKPCWEHPFGTDEFGRSVLYRVLYGTRYSFMIGFGSAAISAFFGITLGAIAGFYGGKTESIIMRFVEIFLMIPNILLTIVIVAIIGISLGNLIFCFGIATIPHFTRNTRAAVMAVCNNEYVEAAKAVGVRDWVIILTHILPNALSPILVQTTIRIGTSIVGAAGFSFLGLGVPVPTPEWGSMMSEARQEVRTNPYLVFFPGLAIFITVLAINMIGDGLRDALDPKLKR